MNNIDKKHIVEGITIDKTKEGYRVFTIPTQHFDILDLDELTNERIEEEIKKQKKYERDSSELFRLYYEEQQKDRKI
jgi:hypothetical protein